MPRPKQLRPRRLRVGPQAVDRAPHWPTLPHSRMLHPDKRLRWTVWPRCPGCFVRMPRGTLSCTVLCDLCESSLLCPEPDIPDDIPKELQRAARSEDEFSLSYAHANQLMRWGGILDQPQDEIPGFCASEDCQLRMVIRLYRALALSPLNYHDSDALAQIWYHSVCQQALSMRADGSPQLNSDVCCFCEVPSKSWLSRGSWRYYTHCMLDLAMRLPKSSPPSVPVRLWRVLPSGKWVPYAPA